MALLGRCATLLLTFLYGVYRTSPPLSPTYSLLSYFCFSPMNSLRLLLLCLLFSSIPVNAQDVEWITPLSFPGREYPSRTIIDIHGNVFLALMNDSVGPRLIKCDGSTGKI